MNSNNNDGDDNDRVWQGAAAADRESIYGKPMVVPESTLLIRVVDF